MGGLTMKMKRKIFVSAACTILATVLLLSCVSCSFQISAKELSAGYKRKAAETVEITDDFKKAMADFSLSLFKSTLTKDGENDIVSPLSAVMCLAMIANGADGNTLAQIESALGMSIDELNKFLCSYSSCLCRSDDCLVTLANSVWFKNSDNAFHVNKQFLQANADWYNAQVYAAPFDNSTLKDINAWVNKYTDGKIKSILDEIPPDALMYLINTLAFDAKWRGIYKDSDINDGIFTNYDGSESDVNMMYSEESHSFSSDNAVGFVKPYNDDYSFIGILPNDGIDIYDYIASLNGDAWTELWNSKELDYVKVRMPEFKYDIHTKLNDALKAMGITDMFSSGADFSKLGACSGGNIFCSSIEQKVTIEVNRVGTTAKAASKAEITLSGSALPEKEICLDRPFVYAIADDATGLPLFLGAVTNLERIYQ